MPVSTPIPIRASAVRQGAWWLLEIARPGHAAEPLGILLADEESGRLALRLRSETEFEDLEEDEADVLAALETDLRLKADEPGGSAALLASLENSLSGFLRISERTQLEYSGSAERAVDRLYDEYVDGEIHPFLTHLPVYALRAAATKFGEEFGGEETGEPESWLRTPRGVRIAEGMFVAQVVGRSMEPLIPDGSFCIFRAPVVGSRQGKRLLIEQSSGAERAGGRYTVKRYASRKQDTADGSWRHKAIRLEPLNPEFEAFELGEGDFKVIAEFVQVLE